jgi:uncharacterized protein involved in response to NO
MTNTTTDGTDFQGPAFFSYGFRPFFFGAALFAGIAVQAWIFVLGGIFDLNFLYPPREWHVHEMVFGFLPCVIAGFLLTAIPNWTDRPPLRGLPLMLLFSLWLAGRISMACPLFSGSVAAIVDSSFLVALAGVVWREIIAGQVWNRAPIGIVISLYAIANIVFHVLALGNTETDLAARMALALLMILLALIGGKNTPGLTEDFFEEAGRRTQALPFSRFDGVSILFVVIAAMAWIVQPQHLVTGWLLVTAGLANVIRLSRWHGWMTWPEPLVLIIHVGYGWLGMSLLILGSSILGWGLPTSDAIHALTTGAVGSMTLAVMTRATLGHTGRQKHAGPLTVLIYLMINLGAILRLLAPTIEGSTTLILGLATIGWSGAYLLFVVVYGPYLLGPSLDND